MRRMVRGTRLVDVKRPEYDEPLNKVALQTVTYDSAGGMSIDGTRLKPTVNASNVVPLMIDGQTVATLLYEAESRRHRWF